MKVCLKVSDNRWYWVDWVASLPALCALIGSLLVSVPMQYLGRRRTLIGIAVPFILVGRATRFAFIRLGFSSAYILGGLSVPLA